MSFALYEDGRLTYDMRYVEYANDLKPRMKLFQRPEGIVYEEAK